MRDKKGTGRVDTAPSPAGEPGPPPDHSRRDVVRPWLASGMKSPAARMDMQTVERSQPYPRRRLDVTVHELDDEALVYDPITGSTHRLNATALLIWYACDGTQDTRAVARRLAEAYDVTEDAAVTHVERLLAALQSQQLLEDGGKERDTGG